MILVTGANGHLGRLIVEHLARRLGSSAATRLAVSVREPAKADDLADRGIEVRHGDFDQAETLTRAFAGVERLVLVSTDGPRDSRIAQHRNAVAAATAAGVKRIVYTSFLDLTPDSPAEFAAVHRATEEALHASGVELAIMRNTLYSDYLPMTIGGALESGVFYLSAGGGRVSFLSRDELAQATAAAALKHSLDKEVYELTGPATHDYREVADALSHVSGKTIRYQAISETDYAQALDGHGVPAWMARAMATMYSAAAAGKFDRVTGDYEQLTGRHAPSLNATITRLFAQ